MSHFAESIQRDLAAERDPNQKASDSLAAVPCSRWALFQRWHDRSRDEWTAWEEITGQDLWEKFGATVDDWKKNAKSQCNKAKKRKSQWTKLILLTEM